jgi:hypothetical protein
MQARHGVVMLLAAIGLAAGPVGAQEPKADSATIARANKPIIRPGELAGVLGTTGLAMILDQALRNRIHDPHDRFGRTASDVGNAIGSGYVYPTLLALAIGGKALGSKGLYGVSSRALKSTLVAGAGGMVLKVMIGRERPTNSPESPFAFHPVSFKDNSFPSGHTTVAFALATSFAREIEGQWDDAIFFTLATLTAYSRMHDDKHWASDVVFGAGVGILSARFVHRREAKIAVGSGRIAVSVAF